jgi:hypothetical protein
VIGLDANRIRAVVRKELRDFRRKRSIIVTMCVLPLLFLVEPVITIFLVTPSTSGAALQKSFILPLLYLLLMPTIMPSTLAAYSVVGEREQGTLEPLLTTPIRQQEFLLGKATSVMIPTLTLSYVAFALFLAAVRLLATPVVASAVFHDSPTIFALFLLAPPDGRLGHCGWHGRVSQGDRGARRPTAGCAGQLSPCSWDHSAGGRRGQPDGPRGARVRRRVAGGRCAAVAIRLWDVRSGTPGDGSQSRLRTGNWNQPPCRRVPDRERDRTTDLPFTRSPAPVRRAPWLHQWRTSCHLRTRRSGRPT